MIVFFFGEEAADATNPFRAGGLDIFPEGIEFLGFGGELLFIQLGEMEAVDSGLFAAKIRAGDCGGMRSVCCER